MRILYKLLVARVSVDIGACGVRSPDMTDSFYNLFCDRKSHFCASTCLTRVQIATSLQIELLALTLLLGLRKLTA